ncbi:type I-D CRISPR-associated protein Cas7/Csc2 [Methanoculleus sp.]|jgi:CRISPR-associated protein Csc2|uniref:type I-D CRISPR-associated protein Cas7/Csc2 n=1 Tax=Methanoculleus sp. TaxID=90427 RepID=UPI001BD358C3|nr:type I-D CRISPR-associated protein Cas7/Csc2 [Methanoculleus sp.]
MNWTELKNEIPNDGFVEKYEIYRRARPTITLAVLRTVTDPILFRSSDSERAETQEFSGTVHAQVNGEKFVSKERLTGLNLCRELDVDGNIIDSEYTYNEPLKDLKRSQTADMLTYGLAGTVSGATFSQKSRVIEGYTYGLEQYDLMNREVHNALYESGTMRDEEGGQSEALFSPAKVQPGTHFVHFVTLEAGTKEMFLYIVHNILNSGRYGARETRTGRNMKNEIIGCITSPFDSCLSCGEMIQDHVPSDKSEFSMNDIRTLVCDYINKHKRVDWKVHVQGGLSTYNFDNFPDWLTKAIDVCERKTEGYSDIMRDALATLRQDGLQTVKKKGGGDEGTSTES